MTGIDKLIALAEVSPAGCLGAIHGIKNRAPCAHAAYWLCLDALEAWCGKQRAAVSEVETPTWEAYDADVGNYGKVLWTFAAKDREHALARARANLNGTIGVRRIKATITP